jgi:hypothetical protein
MTSDVDRVLTFNNSVMELEGSVSDGSVSPPQGLDGDSSW